MDSFILIAAFRYGLGRRSAGVGTIADALVEHAARLADWEREQIVRDIEQAIADGFAGDDCDVQDWRRVARAMRGPRTNLSDGMSTTGLRELYAARETLRGVRQPHERDPRVEQ